LPADAGHVAFLAALERQFEQVVLTDQPVDIAEVQVLLERRTQRSGPVGLAQRRRQVRRAEAAPDLQRARGADLLGLVCDEEVRDVADDRTAEGHAVLFLRRLLLGPGALLELGGLAPVGAGPVPEEAALELVGARTRGC